MELKHYTPPESKGRPQGPKGTVNLPPRLTYEFIPPAAGAASNSSESWPGPAQNSLELIPALRDEDDNICGLAGSSLARLPNAGMVAAYMASQPGATARAEARKALSLIAEMSEDSEVQNAAKEALKQ
ncbi:MAG: hypothetical protein H6652_00195 [Ardenticatenaceae bacterium]|nr:hypothetical protein [Ardenticatenaceae bacterium]